MFAAADEFIVLGYPLKIIRKIVHGTIIKSSIQIHCSLWVDFWCSVYFFFFNFSACTRYKLTVMVGSPRKTPL